MSDVTDLPTVTVVVPTYNRSAMLELALQSVVGQTYPHLECIVVNDDPTTQAAVNHVMNQLDDARFSVIHNQVSLKGGGARNRGIDRGAGALIAFLDDDDQWLDSYLAKHVALHAKEPEVGIVSSGVIMKWQGDVLPEKRLLMKSIPRKVNLQEALLSGQVEVFTSSAFTVKRTALDKVGPFDQELPSFQDWELYYRVSEHYRIANIEEPLTVFYQHLSYRMTGDLESRKRGLAVLSRKVKKEQNFEKFRQKYITQAYFTTVKNNTLLGKNTLNLSLVKSYLLSNTNPLNSIYRLKITIKMLIIALTGKFGLKLTRRF